MKNNLLIIILGLSLLSSGCRKYLDVEPKSSLSEDQLFESEIGFQQALTGVYSQLAGRNLYGDNLTMGFVSAMAQNYTLTGANAPLRESRLLNFTSAEVVNITRSVWSTSYSAIAGLNKIIENTETSGDILSRQNYLLIRGEALALRAMLHFELLRIFGKEAIQGAGQKAIPYKKTADQFAIVPSTTQEVINYALVDLEDAEVLLAEGDPITQASPNRRIKFNYYAVKALEARIRLYMGDKNGAYEAARIVVESGKFSFVTASSASAAAGNRDRIYINEQIFCLRVREMLTWVDFYFRFNGNTNIKLTRSAANFNTLYETASGGSTDIRYLYRIEQDGGAPFPSKYWQTYQFNTMDSTRLDQLVPVIRLAEMYYIMAETAPTPEEGITYLNEVRNNRSLQLIPAQGITATTLQNEITKEYQKEFYAEGQLFFYYKRRNMVRMQFMTSDISLSSYVLPIPDLELEFNPNY